ncbi:MAG: hypothetical protein B0A82_02605 [Alkalinema sp. CACIAM 70d]|nr:MAG: hypothetical protein B0A82_02605 [Alkalinema sp. CACIAM 70d]
MNWIIRKLEDIAVVFTPSDAFTDWLIQRSPAILDWVDPYRDRRLDDHAQRQVLQILQELRSTAEDEIRQYYMTRTKLPQDPEVRQALLTQLITQTLDKQPHWQCLQELESLLTLALSEDLLIECIGD